MSRVPGGVGWIIRKSSPSRPLTRCKLLGHGAPVGSAHPTYREEAFDMAVVVIQEFEATPEEYDQVSEKLGEGTPEGAILHAATDLGGGRMKSIDVWESAEQFQKFVQEKLIPAI